MKKLMKNFFVVNFVIFFRFLKSEKINIFLPVPFFGRGAEFWRLLKDFFISNLKTFLFSNPLSSSFSFLKGGEKSTPWFLQVVLQMVWNFYIFLFIFSLGKIIFRMFSYHSIFFSSQKNIFNKISAIVCGFISKSSHSKQNYFISSFLILNSKQSNQ